MAERSAGGLQWKSILLVVVAVGTAILMDVLDVIEIDTTFQVLFVVLAAAFLYLTIKAKKSKNG